MITSVDWNNDGFAAGSRTVELDWKDWKRPVISLLRAKLLRKRTFVYDLRIMQGLIQTQHTRLEIAVLKSTSKVSSWAERSMLWTPGRQSVIILALTANEIERTFEVKGNYKSGISGSRRHPHTLCCSHSWPCKWSIDQVVEGKAFANRLFTHWRHNFHRLYESNKWAIPSWDCWLKIPLTPYMIEIRIRTTRRTDCRQSALHQPPKVTSPALMRTRRLLTE